MKGGGLASLMGEGCFPTLGGGIVFYFGEAYRTYQGEKSVGGMFDDITVNSLKSFEFHGR